MPIKAPLGGEHRSLISGYVFPAMVAGPVPKSEMMAKDVAAKNDEGRMDKAVGQYGLGPQRCP